MTDQARSRHRRANPGFSWINVGAVAMKRGGIAIAQVVAALMVLMLLVTTIAASAVADARSAVESATTQLAVVSEDPFMNAKSYHHTEVEPDTFAFGSSIVSAFQAGKFPDLGASNLGWSVSTDAGTTWSDGFLPSTTISADPPGPWRRVTDPSVAYDAKHDTWLIFGLESPFHHSVFVNRSTDGAHTFGAPVVVQSSETKRHNFDKTWISCDNHPTSPFYGHCYTEWDDEAHHLRLHMSTSTDGGVTWTKADIRKDTWVLNGHPLIQPDGTVVMPIDQCCPTRIDTFISTDGGLTFSGHGTDYAGSLAIRDVRASKVRGKLRMSIEPPFISADIDAAGQIYVMWPDCRFRHSGPDGLCTQNDIVMSTTSDGRHWSPVSRIPIDARTSSVDHFLPAIAIDPATSGSSAHIAIVYYFYPEADCTAKTCELMVGFVSSTDGGSTWTSQPLAGPFKNTWFPLTDSGYMVGDYVGISFVGGNAIPVFSVASEGTCELGDVTSCSVWTASATIPLVPGS
jgi:hypothetical protein